VRAYLIRYETKRGAFLEKDKPPLSAIKIMKMFMGFIKGVLVEENGCQI